MPLQVKIDARSIGRRYGQALRQMSELSGFPMEQVLKAEAGSILKTWAGRTKVAKPQAISLRARVRAAKALGFTHARTAGDITVNAGLKGPYGRVWVKTKTGKYRMAMGPKFQAVPYRWSSGDWIDIKEAAYDYKRVERKLTAGGKKSAGLSRQSVIQIADALGIDLTLVKGGGASATAIAKARKAMASDGQYHSNGSGRSNLTKPNARGFIRFINTLPYNTGIGMDRQLALIMAGRASYFERNYRLGVFKSLDTLAKKYPGLHARG